MRKDVLTATIGKDGVDDLLEAVTRRLERREDLSLHPGAGGEQYLTKDQLILLSGPSGSGKTYRAQSLKSQLEKKFHNACFLSGKIDQFHQQQSIPLISSFMEISDRLEADGSVNLQLKHEFRHDLSLLVKTIPSLAATFEPTQMHQENQPSNVIQTQEDGRGAGDAKTRFYRVLCRLLRVLCRNWFPIVLFVDDLQWASTSTDTFDMLAEVLLDDDPMDGLVVVAACREISEDAELARRLVQLEQKGVSIRHIRLTNMSHDQQHGHVSRVLDMPKNESRQLSELLYPATGGNYLHLLQIVCLLEDEGLLHRQCDGRWIWDKHSIQDRLQCSDLMQLVVGRLTVQSEDAQDVLKVAACLGSKFKGSSLMAAMNTSERLANVHSIMQGIERKKLMVQDGNHWSFLHDSIQQAAYTLIPQDEKRRLHLDVGRTMLTYLSSEEVESELLVIASQLNHGTALVENEMERQMLARFFLRAAKKAVQLSQFDIAAGFYGSGIYLLPIDHWRATYELSLELYNGSAEVEYVLAKFEKVDLLLGVALSNASKIEDKVRSYTTMLYSLATQSKIPEAIKIARTVLKELGEPMPDRISGTRIMIEYARTRFLLRQRSRDEILALPSMIDPTKLAIMRIMTLLAAYGSFTGGMVIIWLSLRIVRLSIECGVSHMSAIGFAFYGCLACATGSIEHGHEAGQIALKIVDRFDANEFKCRVLGVVANNIGSWSQSPMEVHEQLKVATKIGMDSGDVEFALLSAGVDLIVRTESNDSLRTVLGFWKRLLRMTDRYGQLTNNIPFSAAAQMVANFLGQGKEVPWILTGDFMNEEEAVARSLASNRKAFGTICQFKAVLSVVMGEFDVAANSLSALNQHMKIEEFHHASVMALNYFLNGMASLLGHKRARYRKARRSLKQLRKQARCAPDSHTVKALILAGELAARKSQVKRAASIFEEAVIISKKSQSMTIAMRAVALERRSILLDDTEMPRHAVRYLQEAKDAYNDWDCCIKVEQLNEKLVTRLDSTEFFD